jgi:predicted helicase
VPIVERERLGLPRDDEGIDSVYLSLNDDAYQFKFRTGRPTLCFRDLATFGFLVYKCNFHKKIVVSNSERLEPRLRKSFTLIRGSRLDQLTPDQLKAIADYIKQKPVKKKPHDPRWDQFEAICEINHILRTEARTQCIEACGTGKTLVGLWLMEDRQPKTTLVLVPTLALLSQTRTEWLDQKRNKFIHRCICSDFDDGKQNGEDRDIPPEDCDFPISTRPKDVTDFLNDPRDLPKVIS